MPPAGFCRERARLLRTLTEALNKQSKAATKMVELASSGEEMLIPEVLGGQRR
jgi:hypothetical protein